MLKEERQALILNKLHTSGKVVVSQLAADLKVSEDTVRRDLLDLDQKGLLKRVFGGAIPLERPVIGFFDREEADVELKQKLAERALGFLEPDQLVAIDGSSTNLQFAKNIPSDMTVSYTHLSSSSGLDPQSPVRMKEHTVSYGQILHASGHLASDGNGAVAVAHTALADGYIFTGTLIGKMCIRDSPYGSRSLQFRILVHTLQKWSRREAFPFCAQAQSSYALHRPPVRRK